MRNKITLVLLLITIPVFGQEFNFDIHNTSLSEYIKIEENLGSERIPTTSNHVSFSGEAQPIKFKRTEKIIPDLIVYYYFKEKDSAMSFILYEWDVYNFERQDNNQKSKKFEKALIKKYRDLKNKITKKFGEPKTKSDYSNVSRLDPENTFVESSTWKPNDSTEIELYTTVSNYYEKKGAFTVNPVHRIRLYIRNKSKQEKIAVPKLDEKRVDSLNVLVTDFFKSLESREFEKSREYLSDLIKEKTTKEQLNSLADNLDFSKDLEIIYSGVQMGFDGSVYTLLQYKYSNDTSNPPSELIKIIFDDKNKIVGIQPIKLKKEITD